ncbi:hypothetical protein D1872_88590 [compost metagenome]
MIDMLDMTDQQLNRALAELVGWSNFKTDGQGNVWGTPSDDRWSNSLPRYCNDPAASLEVQAKALEASYVKYCEELRKVTNPTGKWYSDAIELAASLLGATARQRAEAAYMTLSSRD